MGGAELAIWVNWQHRGILAAESNSVLVLVSGPSLAQELLKSPAVFARASAHCRKVVQCLEELAVVTDVTDVISFSPKMTYLQKKAEGAATLAKASAGETRSVLNRVRFP